MSELRTKPYKQPHPDRTAASKTLGCMKAASWKWKDALNYQNASYPKPARIYQADLGLGGYIGIHPVTYEKTLGGIAERVAFACAYHLLQDEPDKAEAEYQDFLAKLILKHKYASRMLSAVANGFRTALRANNGYLVPEHEWCNLALVLNRSQYEQLIAIIRIGRSLDAPLEEVPAQEVEDTGDPFSRALGEL